MFQIQLTNGLEIVIAMYVSEALKILRKRCQTWPGQADKNFQGRTKIFNIIAENFCPRIKIFGGTIFFLTPLLVEKASLVQCETPSYDDHAIILFRRRYYCVCTMSSCIRGSDVMFTSA